MSTSEVKLNPWHAALACRTAVLLIGPDFAGSARESADCVDRILRGARPAELPVSVRVRADRVIE